MPAGMIGQYLTSQQVLRQGRDTFNDVERALVEFGRYRCFLLGLPEELLPTSPTETVHVMHARAALLRDGFDPVCRELVDSTMTAYLRPTTTLFDRAAEAVEKGYSKESFVRAFCNGDRSTAAAMGVSIGVADRVRIALTGPFIAGRFVAVRRAGGIPALRGIVDRYIIRQENRFVSGSGSTRMSCTIGPQGHHGTAARPGSRSMAATNDLTPVSLFTMNIVLCDLAVISDSM